MYLLKTVLVKTCVCLPLLTGTLAASPYKELSCSNDGQNIRVNMKSSDFGVFIRIKTLKVDFSGVATKLISNTGAVSYKLAHGANVKVTLYEVDGYYKLYWSADSLEYKCSSL